jgi:hypothetical protein
MAHLSIWGITMSAPDAMNEQVMLSTKYPQLPFIKEKRRDLSPFSLFSILEFNA